MFLQRSEAGKAFHLVRESTKQNVSTILWATGVLNGGSQNFDIPVDSMTQRITFVFSVNTKGTGLALRQPSGQLVSEASAHSDDTELNCGRIVTIASPDRGIWRAEITGAGTFWIEAKAQSDINLISAEFVHRGGRPGHEGLFRIQGQPVAGNPAILQATLSASATRTAEFYLFTQHGEPIQKLSMHRVNSDREFLEFEGKLRLPDGPFRLAVLGRDLKGRRYQRFFAPLFHAETVEVSPMIDTDEMSAGSPMQVGFAVRNVGTARNFKLTATDSRQFITKVEPKDLPLGADKSGIVTVSLAAPAGTAPGMGDDLVVVASSTSGSATSNSSVVHLLVSSSSTSQAPH
jgi:von Willebrand factor A domain-containing protein 7